jgi:glycosyltransferase involved in cell wall biosynthesis
MLAVTHEASLTGAPMVFADLMEWIAGNTDIEIDVLLLQDGPLRDRLEHVADVTGPTTTRWGSTLDMAAQVLIARGSRNLAPKVEAIRLRRDYGGYDGYDLLYLNSQTTLDLLPFLPRSGPVVSHIHELGTSVRLFQSIARDPGLLREGPDHWIAAAGAVRDMLVQQVGCPPDRVHLHHAFIRAHEIAARRVDPDEVARLRTSVGIPEGAAVVMASGTVDWRKAPDVFIQLAGEVQRRTDRPVHFVWVGGDLTSDDWIKAEGDLQRAGTPNVHFTGLQTDPIPWYRLADVFVLTSHEDPFPLVCLEHAALGHPIVTFRNGGMPELLEPAGPEAAAGVVDHLDVSGMASRVIELLDHEGLRRTAGEQLKARVLAHHDLAVAAPALVADLERIAGSS